MSIHFHPLRIREVRKETPECVSVSFDIPPELVDDFQFKQGQSLTVRSYINGEEVRRTYSICSSPLDKEWRVAIKEVDGGLFSTFANRVLKAGDTLEVMQPVGKFYTELDPSNHKNYLAFAAGSGITPVLSLIKTTLVTEPHSDFTLVFGNRNRSSIIFFEELEALKNKYMERFNLVHVLSRERTDAALNFGRIDIEKLQQLDKVIDYSATDEFFICGPEEMIFAVKAFLEAKGIDKKQIHFELFTTPGQKYITVKPPKAGTEEGPQCHITIKLDGRSFDFELGLNSGTSVLDATQPGSRSSFCMQRWSLLHL